MDWWNEILCNRIAVGQELLLFNYCSHARGFALFQDATPDVTIAAYSQWRRESDLGWERHLDFNRSAIGDRLWQAEIHAARTHVLGDRACLALSRTIHPSNS
jgi:hypothetical protein